MGMQSRIGMQLKETKPWEPLIGLQVCETDVPLSSKVMTLQNKNCPLEGRLAVNYKVSKVVHQ